MRLIRRRLGLILGLLTVVLLTAACTSPSPKVTSQPRPTSTLTAAPTVHEFVSTLYNFRLTLPKDWTGADATDNWDGEALQGVYSSSFADFQESGIDRLFTFGAAPVAMGTTLAAWRATVVHGAAPGCVDARPATKATLGGEPALTWTSTCPDVRTVKFAVVHGAHGYAAIFVPSGSRMNAADLAVFDPILRSFHFTS
jgi:hypothetical protein